VAGACLGAPTKGGNELHGAVGAWLASHPHCRPEVYYQQVPAATADGASVGHGFPRALQRTTGWEALLDGRESRTGAARPMLLFCGGSMKLRGARADQLKVGEGTMSKASAEPHGASFRSSFNTVSHSECCWGASVGASPHLNKDSGLLCLVLAFLSEC